MLSYRHAFHAGNHADVLKHLVLMLCIEHMNSKDKPYTLIDSHAGAGFYALDAEHAKRTGEFVEGIGRLWQRTDLPPPLAEYVALVRGINGGSGLRRYPGSPRIASLLTRDNAQVRDSLRLCELHSTDFALLRRQFKDAGRRVMLEQADGFEVLKAALPPPSRRGLVLIDPSYEIKSDYMKVAAAIKDGLKRFATGTYLVWHPMLPTIEANNLPDKLKKSGASHWLHATLERTRRGDQGTRHARQRHVRRQSALDAGGGAGGMPALPRQRAGPGRWGRLAHRPVRAGREERLKPGPLQPWSSARSRKNSSASGLASASTFFTAAPCTTLRTASSTILPLLVRGMSATCRIFAGTWRGVVLSRITCLMRFSSASSSVSPSRSLTNSTTRTSPLLPGGQSWPMTIDSTTSVSFST